MGLAGLTGGVNGVWDLWGVGGAGFGYVGHCIAALLPPCLLWCAVGAAARHPLDTTCPPACLALPTPILDSSPHAHTLRTHTHTHTHTPHTQTFSLHTRTPPGPGGSRQGGLHALRPLLPAQAGGWVTGWGGEKGWRQRKKRGEA